MVEHKKSNLSRVELKAKTREKLLEAAIETLIEEGYAGFSMNKVAKRAGIAQPSFYVHFENVDQLFEALAEDVLERFIKPFQISLEVLVQNLKPDEVQGMVYRMFIVAFDIIRSQKPLVTMVWAEREQPASPLGSYLRKFYRDHKNSWAAVLVNIGLVSNSAQEQVRLNIFMDGIFALFENYASFWLSGRYADVKDLAKALTDYVMFYWRDEMARFFEQTKITV